MTEDDGSGMPSFRSGWDRVTYLIAEYKVAVIVSVAAAILLFGTGRASVPDLPEWLDLYLTAVALGLVPATVLGKVTIVNWFMPDPRLVVAEIDPRDGVLVAVHRVTRGAWANRARGAYASKAPERGKVDHIVTALEWNEEKERLVVEGVNEELTDPTELIGIQGKIDEVYGELNETYRNYHRLLNTLDARLLRYDEQQTTAIFEAIETGGTFDSGAIRDVIDPDEIQQEIEEPDADDRDPRSSDPYDREPEDGERRTLTELIEIENRAQEATNGHKK